MGDYKRPSAITSTLALAGLCALLVFPTSAHAERYVYDDAGRLISVVYADLSSIAYSYDDAGNMLSVTTSVAGIPGDADLDGDVDDDDIAAIVAIILAGGQPYSPTADCNGDDRVSAPDLVCAVTEKGTS
jgi:YD repeat-containing protein